MSTMLYKPLGLAFSVAGGILAGTLFKKIWKLIADDEPPEATDRDRGWTEVLLAAAVQGAVFGLVKAAVDRGGARGYERVTGVWPGKE
jgi:Protein of unknown function (DUF4235)